MSELLLLSIVLLLIAFLFRVDFIYYVFYVVLGIFLTGQFILPRIVRSLRLERSFNRNAFLGEEVKINLTVSNSRRLPVPWLLADESIPPVLRVGEGIRQAMYFKGKETRVLSYRVRAMKRGYYRLGPLMVSAGDLFGIREVSSRLAPDHITVFPRIVPLAKLGLPSNLPFGTIRTNRRIFEDPARPVGIRDYRSGDSIRHINWKVSAHSDELLIRTFEPVQSLETMLLLNLNPQEYSRQNRYDGPEWAIVVSASIAAYLSSVRQAVGLATNGIDPLSAIWEDALGEYDAETGRLQCSFPASDQAVESLSEGVSSSLEQIPPKPGRIHLMRLLEKLARIERQVSLPYAQWIPLACSHLSWGVTIIAITPTTDANTFAALHQLVKSGFTPVLIVVEPYKDLGEIRERARRLGFNAYKASEQRDLAKWHSDSISRAH